jgi:hypothetical protein
VLRFHPVSLLISTAPRRLPTSFEKGLGELTFLQLSTTYSRKLSGISVGYFASGTGAAGLVGALLWWEVRGLGVREGVGLSSVRSARRITPAGDDRAKPT